MGRIVQNHGSAGLALKPAFSTFLGRKKDEEGLDEAIGEWTRGLEAEEVMTRLQAAGVPAGVVKNAGEIYGDRQLRRRNLFWPLPHSEIGTSRTWVQALKCPALRLNPIGQAHASANIPLTYARRCSEWRMMSILAALSKESSNKRRR